MVGKRLCHYTNVIYLKARFGKGSIHSDRYRYIEMRGYNPYAVKLLALALFIVPLLRKGGIAVANGQPASAQGEIDV